LRAFGDNALQWEICCFVPRPQDHPTTANDLLLQINQAFRQNGIAIPFPQQDVHLRSADAALVIQPTGNCYTAVAAHADQSTPYPLPWPLSVPLPRSPSLMPVSSADFVFLIPLYASPLPL